MYNWCSLKVKHVLPIYISNDNHHSWIKHESVFNTYLHYRREKKNNVELPKLYIERWQYNYKLEIVDQWFARIFSCPNRKNLNDLCELDLWPIDTPSHASDHLCQIGKESIKSVHAVDWTHGIYFSSFITISWLNDLEDIDRRSLCMAYPLMLVIQCVRGYNNISFTICLTT